MYYSLLNLESLMINPSTKTETYWIVIAGLRGSGKSTFLRQAAETTSVRDRQDMSVITTEDQQRVMDWLSRTGSALDPERTFYTEEEQLFTRWARRITIGEIQVDSKLTVCLYEAPGALEFDFLWQVMSPSNYLGCIVVLDSTRHHLIRDASRLAATFASYSSEPYVFAANKQDDDNAMSAEDIRILLQFLDGHLLPVLPCVASDSMSVQHVLLRLLELIRDDYDDGISW